MRFLLRLCAALFALAVSLPAQATIYLDVSVSGTLAGTSNTVMCGVGSPMSCFVTYPSGQLSQPYSQPFNLALGIIPLEEGDNNFSFGSVFGSGLYEGIITNTGGVLTGYNLNFSRADSSCRTGSVGCTTIFASAANFNVSGGVPEPDTWLLMLLGFGALGVAFRRARSPVRSAALAPVRI